MAYGQDLAGSARRHFTAADRLYDDDRPARSPGSKAVAGYLYGLAGELALKHMMKDSGMRPLEDSQRRDDPFYAHFPQLKTLLRDSALGRRHAELLGHATKNELFQDWHTNMRYAPTTDVQQTWTTLWRDQAKALVDSMDLP
jgi:hypothetical protein